jgi:hypothetical protein
MSHDIMESLHDIRAAFLKCNLEVPAVIVLKTHEEGMRLLHAIRDKPGLWTYDPRSGAAGKPVEHPDGSIYMSIEIMGLNIRWPANRIAVQNEGYLWT